MRSSFSILGNTQPAKNWLTAPNKVYDNIMNIRLFALMFQRKPDELAFFAVLIDTIAASGLSRL